MNICILIVAWFLREIVEVEALWQMYVLKSQNDCWVLLQHAQLWEQLRRCWFLISVSYHIKTQMPICHQYILYVTLP